ncbi:MAG: molybdenum cofactor guanylyltransferase [Chloroflexi bacterium]|nr:molybdenum cofactor guanylyltransferase [Chloroflexota bacterium]
MLTGVVLAGGYSSRLGGSKPSVEVAGMPLLQYALTALGSMVDEVVITIAPDQTLPSLRSDVQVVVCEDLLPDRGPLTGIFTGLQCARSEYAIVIPCDAPFIEPELLRLLLDSRHGHDAVIPVVDGRPDVMLGVYRKTCIPALERALNSDDFAVSAFLRHLRVCYIDEEQLREADGMLRSFFNVNSREQLATARQAFVIAQHP